MQEADDRIQMPEQVRPIVWNALWSAKSGFILRYSRYHQPTTSSVRLYLSQIQIQIQIQIQCV